MQWDRYLAFCNSSSHSFTYIDCLDGILNLIDSAFWRESVDTTIVVLLAVGLKKTKVSMDYVLVIDY